MKKRGLKKGFTLSELLVVVLVIGILAAIATPMYNKAIKKSRASDALHVLTTASEKQENYFVNNGKYAKSFSELSAPIKGLNAAAGNAVKVGNFSYQMTDSCVVADRSSDKYKIYKNFVTQQEGCVGEGCIIIKDMVPTVSSVGCEAVSGETEGPSVGPTDPCIATPALCCPNGSVWDATQSKCTVKNPCSDGKIFNPVTKTCVCNNSCSGDGVQNAETCACACPTTCPLTGQVRDAFCNCVCPADKPNWNGSSCTGGCAAPKTRWTGNGCECPLDNPIWNGSSCIKCPSHLTFNGTTCACPDGLPNEWGGHCYACSEPNFNSGKSNCADTSTGPAGIFTDIMCSCACNEKGSAFQNGKCVCVVPTPVWTGSVCEKCPDIQEWDGAQCVCPTDKPVWTGSVCISCPDIQIWDTSSNKCACPAEYPVWDGSKCSACPEYKPWDGTKCTCGKETPYEYNNTCNQCKQSEHISNGICCPQDKVSNDGKTCVGLYKYKPKHISAGVLVDCHNSYSYTDKNKNACRRTGAKSYFDGGKLPDIAAIGGKYWVDFHHAYYYGDMWWEGGRHLGKGLYSCSGTDYQGMCDKNCSSSNPTCNYKCVKSESVPDTCGVYKASNGKHCDNSSGSAQVMECIRDN